MKPGSVHRRTRVITATAGLMVVTVYAVVALVQILVWNPEAAVPGLTAAEVWREVGAANQGPPNAFVVAVIAAGPVLGLVFLLVFALTDADVWAVVSAYLALLLLGIAGYFVASFGPGMGLADTYGISGGDYAYGGAALGAVSLLAMLALLAIFAGGVIRGRRARRASVVV
ncbi:hypothetical protein QE410_001009 [Microbacterium sp. SORGH_AS 1204]|uniref:hypothetical protein n=1 Tax=Microbacterium sp. SORGH_AS_1204 TaxID=3041785 RepID=UPI00278D903C|nr:hypothetical protein [Microbacterium sp. SORGH_AS_1204]MDQ1136210.1 hypothetical protein [Microbacterium sp. SORGH_AS_1204]